MSFKSISKSWKSKHLLYTIIPSNQRHIICSYKPLLITWNGFCRVAMFNEWCLSLVFVFNISKNMWGFFQWVWHEGIKFNIIGDKGCDLLPWLMLTHKQIDVSHFVLEALFNNQFSCVISYSIIVVENNFDIFFKVFMNWWSSSIEVCIFFQMWLSIVTCYTMWF
jgi:hypothetical protein